MANYSTQFSFSFSVGNKAGELIQQALTYFGEDEEDRDADVFSPEWESVFAAHNNEPENWANEVSGETATGCKFEVVTKDAETRVSVWAEEHGSVDLTAAIIVTGLQLADDDAVVTFEYAFTCDKPVLGAFGGGACAMHKSGYLARGTCDLAAQLAKDVVN